MNQVDIQSQLKSLWASVEVPPTPDTSLDSEPTEWTNETQRLYREACRYFDDITQQMNRRNPEGLDFVVEEVDDMHQPCYRCLGLRSYLALIHGGESIRRDCAACGSFVDFVVWHNRDEAATVFSKAREGQ